MRREFPNIVKVAAFKRAAGRCEVCTAKLMPGNIHYDHRNPDGLTGEPTYDNCQVLCRNCHGAKTRKDVNDIAKAKRRERRNAGIRPPRKMTRWRRFNGDPVYATRSRD